jgi:pimeloyl-ACP methyl ester carboxylesterase
MENSENGWEVVSDNILQVIKNVTSHEGFTPLCLVTKKGQVQCRFYELPEFDKCVIYIGGTGGDWDSPSRLLYPHLCTELKNSGIASLRVRFRDSHSLDESVFDVIAALSFLRSSTVKRIALVGHSFGGAVAVRAASIDTNVKVVVTLATQSYGAGPAEDLGPRCALLLLHGAADPILPASSSEHIFALAREPKELVIYKNATHNLDEVAKDVYDKVKEWIVKQL